MSLQRFLPIVILFLLPTLISQAQINEGTVIGTVQDAAGAAVPGAQVEVTNVATNVAISTTTNSDGRVPRDEPGRRTLYRFLPDERISERDLY